MWKITAFCGGLIVLCWLVFSLTKSHRPPSYAQNSRDALWLITGLGGFLIAFIWVIPLTMKPYFGKGAILTDEGVGAIDHDETVWFLPWDQFGGYREANGGSEKGKAIEVIDRAGETRGTLMLIRTHSNQGGSGGAGSAHLKRLVFFKRLDAHGPEGGPKILPVQPRERRPQSILATVLKFLGFVFSASMGIYLVRAYILASKSEDPFHGPESWAMTPWVALGSIGFFSFAVFFLITAVSDIAHRRRPNFLSSVPTISEPNQGPSYAEHMVELGDTNTVPKLIPGVKYRRVHVEAQENSLLANGFTFGIMLALYDLTLPVGLWHVLFGDVKRGRPFLNIGVFAVAFSILMYRGIKNSISNLRDLVEVEVEVDGDRLQVWKPDGRLLTFTRPWWAKVLSKPSDRNLIFWGNRQFYSVSSRLLYADPDDQSDTEPVS